MFNVAYYIGVSVLDGLVRILRWLFKSLVIALVILTVVVTTLIITCDKDDKPSEDGQIERVHR